ncbi:MAG TPA: acyl-CoA dehydrogenase family protein [Gemmatimonadaceae bacterium]|nr:acyl-CoA dehydrogenase family protein [Gemmatimonadaceae bacterium]
MEFSWSAEQLQLREAIIAFGRQALSDDLIARDRNETFSRELWTRCAEFGLIGLPFPVEYGGGGSDVLTTVLAMETLGYVCKDDGLSFGINAQMWSVMMPIHRFGTPEQKERYLTRLCSGEWIGAHGMSEPDSGSDAFSLRTTARLDGDSYVLNGTKTFVSNAPVADVFVVFTTVDRSLGSLGLTAFLVERDTPGFRVGRPLEKMGLRTSLMAELIFEDCRVPVKNRIGREGRAVGIFNDSMEWERSCILAPCLGGIQRQLESGSAYAREREQFGQSIGKFASVSQRLVAMKVRLEIGRLALYRAAWLKMNGQPASEAAAIAKLYVSDAWTQTCIDAIQLRGGYGFMTDYEVERDLRNAIGSTLYSGTSDIQRALIARSLGF